jgi:1-acyl-sn-glycerol-3-phosphate acyltransferase
MTSLLAKLLRVLLTGTAFLWFWSGGCVLSWIVVPTVSWWYRKDPVRSARRVREIMCAAFRLHLQYMRVCRLIDFDAAAVGAQLPDKPFVLVANHPTLIDVVLLLASHPSICCVAKSALFNGPMVGRLLRQGGHINAGTGTAIEGAGVVMEAIRRLEGGDSVLIFPEGTRSPAEGLGRFKSGAFAIAARAGVPLIPVLVDCTPRGLMKGMPWYTVPDGSMRFTMSVLPSVDPRHFGGDVKALKKDVEARYAGAIAARAATFGGAELDGAEALLRGLDGSVGA